MASNVLHSTDFVLVVFELQGEGKSVRNIAQDLDNSRGTINAILQKYDPVTGKLRAPGKRRRPRCTTAEQDHIVIDYFEEKRLEANVRQAGADLEVLKSTVWNRLEEANGHHVHCVLEDLNQAHKDKREHWCLAKREYLREDPTFFDEILFPMSLCSSSVEVDES